MTEKYDKENEFSNYWTVDQYLEVMIYGNTQHSYFPLMGLLNQYGDIVPKGQRLMTVGNGPCILEVINLSRKFDEIYITEYLPEWRQSVLDWAHAGKNDNEWSFIFDKGAEIENIAHPENMVTGQDLKERVRRKLKAVMHSDAYKAVPIDDESILPVDFIVDIWSLSYVTDDVNRYTQLIKNVSNMLKSGGHYVLGVELGKAMDGIGLKDHGRVDKCVFLTAESFTQVLKNVGLEIVRMDIFSSKTGKFKGPNDGLEGFDEAVVLTHKP